MHDIRYYKWSWLIIGLMFVSSVFLPYAPAPTDPEQNSLLGFVVFFYSLLCILHPGAWPIFLSGMTLLWFVWAWVVTWDFLINHDKPQPWRLILGTGVVSFLFVLLPFWPGALTSHILSFDLVFGMGLGIGYYVWATSHALLWILICCCSNLH